MSSEASTGAEPDLFAAELVADDETVCRLGFAADIPIARGGYPDKHDPATGLIRLEEISWEDLKRRGFSLQIRRLYSFASAMEEAQRRNAEKSRTKGVNVNYRLAGAHLVEVGTVHAIEDGEGLRVFRVMDTRTPEHPAHAEIRIADHLPKSGLLKYRQSLQTALGPLREAELIDDD